MKILFLTKRYYTGKDLINDRYGRLFEIPYGLSQLGHHVTVVAFDYQNRESVSLEDGDLVMISLPANPYLLPSLPTRVKDQSWDVIISSGHINICDYGDRLAKRLVVPHLLDLYDYYPIFLKLGQWIGSYWLHRLLRRARGASVVSPALKEWVGKSCEARLIPNGVDTERFKPGSKNAAREQLGLSDEGKIIGVFGALRPDLGSEEVRYAIQTLAKSHPEVQFLIAGTGGESFELYENVHYKGMLSQEVLVDHYNACDCVLIPYRKSSQVYYSHSARFAEFMACQVPIVATRTGVLSFWLPEDFAGWCNANDGSSLVEAIHRQLELRQVIELPESLTWGRIVEDFEGLVKG